MSRRTAWAGAALRDLRRLDAQAAARVRQAIARFAETEVGDVRRLQGVEPPAWRLRVGDYRVLFHFEEAAANDKDRREWLIIEHVLHRREAYR